MRRLEDHLHRKLDALLRKARRAGVVQAIGTSGTINALVAMARVARDGEQDRLHGLSIPATDVTWLRNRLLKLSADERAELPGADPKRADLMPAAAVLADFVLEHAGAPELVACTWALREGILLSMVNAGARGRGSIEARRRSVSALARRFGALNGHGPQVARLATQDFRRGRAGAQGGPAGARAARTRRAVARHRPRHRPRSPQPPHLLPGQERRAVGLRPVRDRDHRAGRPWPSQALSPPRFAGVPRLEPGKTSFGPLHRGGSAAGRCAGPKSLQCG